MLSVWVLLQNVEGKPILEGQNTKQEINLSQPSDTNVCKPAIHDGIQTKGRLPKDVLRGCVMLTWG